MSRAAVFTPQAQRDIEANFDNQREAFTLLDLIVAEWESDPTSVQCFDLRMVERAKLCVARRKAFLKRNPLA
jgi:hypothetical protein